MKLSKWKQELISEIMSPKTLIAISIGIFITVVANYIWTKVSFQSTPIHLKVNRIGSIFNIDIPKQYNDNLSITYNGEEIENAYIFEYSFESISDYAINADKFEIPITIDTGYRKVISTFATDCSSSYIEGTLNAGMIIEKYKIILPSITLNPKDSFKIIIITDGKLNFNPDVSYRITGYPEYYNDGDNSFIFVAGTIITGIVIFILSSIVIIWTSIKKEKSAAQQLKEKYSILVPKKQYKNAIHIKESIEKFEWGINKSTISDEVKENIIKEYRKNIVNDFKLETEVFKELETEVLDSNSDSLK